MNSIIFNPLAWFLLVIMSLTNISCTATEESMMANSKSSSDSGDSPISKIISDPDAYEGQKMVITGVFAGQQGVCKSPPPVSRGDWMIEDGKDCLYVHGPLPDGVSMRPLKKRPLVLEGTIRVKNGNAYLDLSSN